MREKGLCSIRGVKGDTSQRVHCFHDLIHHRRLHRKPRNIFLLGIIVSYLTFLIRSGNHRIDLLRIMYPDDSVCQAYLMVFSCWTCCWLWLTDLSASTIRCWLVASREDDGSFRVRRHTGLTGFRTVNKAKVLSISIIGAWQNNTDNSWPRLGWIETSNIWQIG